MSPEVSVDDDLGLDHSWQYWHERPAADEDDDVDELDREAEDVVYATDPDPGGEVRAENVPVPDVGRRDGPPDRSGQTSLDEWGGSR